MPDTNTTNYGFLKPEVGGSTDTWGEKLNDNFEDIDGILIECFKNDGGDIANNKSPQLNMGGYKFALEGTLPATPTTPDTRTLVIKLNGVTIFRLNATGLVANDLTAKTPV